MSDRRVVLIRSVAEEFRLVSAQVPGELRWRKAQEVLERKNRICNVVSAQLAKKESRKA